MWTVLCVLVVVSGSVFGRPQESANPPIQIVSQHSAVSADGSFNSSYETADGIKVVQSGYIKPGVGLRSGANGEEESGDIQVVEGSFSYTAPDGTPISLSYTADELGFHPVGDHLPTSPPIPEAIQRSLSLLPDTSASSEEKSA